MSHYQLTHEAECDLDDILDYGIDTFGLEQAIKYYDELTQRFSLLAEKPDLYPADDHIKSGYRRSGETPILLDEPK